MDGGGYVLLRKFLSHIHEMAAAVEKSIYSMGFLLK